MIVIVESATANPVDFLLVNGGSGAAISPEDFSVPGQISRTLTWAVPPTDVVLNVLWSKDNFGGNWQLSPSDVTIPFGVTCTPTPPMSPYCETQVLHLGIPSETASAVNLTIETIDANTMIVIVESATADPVDFLLVNGGSGAVISGENFSVPGQISRTLFWGGGPPTDVVLNVLWSKEMFGGNWQLSPGDVTIPFGVVCPADPAPPVSPYCEEEVQHLGIPAETNSSVFLTIETIDDFNMKVTVESATADPVDFLLVNGGSGATISPEDFSVTGKISRTLTWNVPPTDVVLNVLWSKDNFGGNWQLSPGDVTIPFGVICPFEPAPPVSDYCEAPTFHFAGDPPSEVFLTIETIDDFNMKVTVKSATADPVDLLIVTGGSGAAISAEDFSVPNQISRTLTFNLPPTDVALNVLWSKQTFGGNWQLSTGDIIFPFGAVCPLDSAPIPTMGEWSLFYLALIILIFGIVAIQQTQTSLQPSMAGASQPSINFSFRSFPFEWKAYLGSLKMALAFVPIGFLLIFFGWGEIIIDDLFGMAIALPLVAYVIYLIRRA